MPASNGDTNPETARVGVRRAGRIVRISRVLLLWCAVVAGGAGASSASALTSAPTIDGEWSADVTATSAMLQAQVDPSGSDTHYYFQYGTSDCTISPASCVDVPAAPGIDIGSAESDQKAGVYLQGLSPGSAYHFRVIASNELGVAEGADRTLITYPLNGQPTLPDDRAYELVSPTETNGGDVGGGALGGKLASGLGQSSANGDAVTYVSSASFDEAKSAKLVTEYLSSRTAAGWTTQAISPPATMPGGLSLSLSPPYDFFSADLSAGLLDWGDATLVSGAPQGFDNLYVYGTSSGGYQLVTDVTPTDVTPENYSVKFAGASPDLGRVLFEANAPLTAGAPAEAQSLYAWSGGALRLMSVLPGPGGAAAASAGAGDGQDDIFANDVSSDGSRIFWTDNNSQLYVREDEATTIQLDSSQREPSLGNGSATFRAATPDGSTVFFTDTVALTNDPGDHGGGLYEYDFNGDRLTDLTPDGGGAPGIEGVVGVGDAGSSVYFVATAALAADALEGADNLYVVHSGRMTFIATLSGEDANDWTQSFANRTARVTSNGEHVVFMSNEGLTGYDNVDANTGKRDTEVFVYDDENGQLSCASCNPSNERPIGPSSIPGGLNPSYAPRAISSDGSEVFFDSWDILLPGDTSGQQNVYEYENGKVSLISSGASDDISAFTDASENGENVFFTTRAQLVGQDRGENAALYDARVGGGFPSAIPSVPCSGEACRGPLSAPPAPAAIATAVAAIEPEDPVSSSKPSGKQKKSKLRKPRRPKPKKHRATGREPAGVKRKADTGRRPVTNVRKGRR